MAGSHDEGQRTSGAVLQAGAGLRSQKCAVLFLPQDERTGLSMLVDHFGISQDGLGKVLDDLPDLVKYRDVVRGVSLWTQPHLSQHVMFFFDRPS